jgi:hypothetical protein
MQNIEERMNERRKKNQIRKNASKNKSRKAQGRKKQPPDESNENMAKRAPKLRQEILIFSQSKEKILSLGAYIEYV